MKVLDRCRKRGYNAYIDYLGSDGHETIQLRTLARVGRYGWCLAVRRTHQATSPVRGCGRMYQLAVSERRKDRSTRTQQAHQGRMNMARKPAKKVQDEAIKLIEG